MFKTPSNIYLSAAVFYGGLAGCAAEICRLFKGTACVQNGVKVFVVLRRCQQGGCSIYTLLCDI